MDQQSKQRRQNGRQNRPEATGEANGKGSQRGFSSHGREINSFRTRLHVLKLQIVFSERITSGLLWVALCLGATGSSSLADGPTGGLELQVGGLASDKGSVLVALFDTEQSYDRPAEPVRKKKLMISEHKTQVSFGGLPPGDYALRVFHDENDNGVIDTNWAGIPSEAFGFSNGAMGRFGPPSFDDAKFRIESEAVNMTVRLKQF